MTIAAKKLDPVTRSRLHEEIVSQMIGRIVEGRFRPGERLPAEREIAANLQVNRATLREALKKLEVMGLVEIRHGDGIYVKNYLESGNLELFKAIVYLDEVFDPGILADTLAIRKIIVPEMAARAAANRTDEQLGELKSIALAEGEKDMLERDLGVHHLLARASGNLLYIFILNFFNQFFRDHGYLYFSDPENRRRSARFHRDIYGAVAAKQTDRSQKIMTEVLTYTEEKIFAFYKMNYGARGAKRR
ncbi:MAG TPA: FadR/GntR family transcriptional regulator [Spirochaetota bacterium]|nr:FadR/GntR family transcriptional regulator [Spirochaetota bacterium]